MSSEKDYPLKRYPKRDVSSQLRDGIAKGVNFGIRSLSVSTLVPLIVIGSIAAYFAIYGSIIITEQRDTLVQLKKGTEEIITVMEGGSNYTEKLCTIANLTQVQLEEQTRANLLLAALSNSTGTIDYSETLGNLTNGQVTTNQLLTQLIGTEMINYTSALATVIQGQAAINTLLSQLIGADMANYTDQLSQALVAQNATNTLLQQLVDADTFNYTSHLDSIIASQTITNGHLSTIAAIDYTSQFTTTHSILTDIKTEFQNDTHPFASIDHRPELSAIEAGVEGTNVLLTVIRDELQDPLHPFVSIDHTSNLVSIETDIETSNALLTSIRDELQDPAHPFVSINYTTNLDSLKAGIEAGNVITGDILTAIGTAETANTNSLTTVNANVNAGNTLLSSIDAQLMNASHPWASIDTRPELANVDTSIQAGNTILGDILLELESDPGVNNTGIEAGINTLIKMIQDMENSFSKDSFARMRVSEPFTLWDSKLLGDSRLLLWDEQQVSGAGTSGVYTALRSSVKMFVSASTAGRRVRQTKQRFNYQPGKSQLIFITGTLGSPEEGVTRRIGYFDDDNGIFFQLDGSELSVVLRSSTTGVATDLVVLENEWNVDGGADVIKTNTSQIFAFDMEWLGVGTVRCGIVIDGKPQYLHHFHHANKVAGVYMTTPNLPVRYEISNDGTGGAAEVECICSTVMSEGGANPTGIVNSVTTVPNHLDANDADTNYALIGIRLKTTHLSNVVKIIGAQLINQQADDFYWEFRLNPTVAGTFTYNDEPNLPIQAAFGVTANTVSGGTRLQAGISVHQVNSVSIEESLVHLGSTIDGTRDTIVLCVTPLTPGADIQGIVTIQWS